MKIDWDCSPAPNPRFRHWRVQISTNYQAFVSEDLKAGTFHASGVNGGVCKATEDKDWAQRKALMAVRRQALNNIKEAEQVIAFLDAVARELAQKGGGGGDE